MGVSDRASLRLPWRNRITEPEIHDVLRNERRRRALRCLCDRGGTLHVDELVETIADSECDEQPSPAALRRSVYSSLHQTHLPKLEQSDVAVYDKESNVVSLTANAREVDRYMRLRSLHGHSWGEYYQLFAVTSLMTVLLVELEVWVFRTVEITPVVTVLLALLALSASYQIWRRRWIYLRSLTR